MKTKKYKCPCCGYFALDDEPGRYDICLVCRWEDDGYQLDYPDYGGGANEVSLKQARENYKEIGAIEECYLDLVRPPLSDELASASIEELSDNEKTAFEQYHKANLVRQYHNIQRLLQRSDFDDKTVQNLKRNVAILINDLRMNGIAVD